MDTIQRPAGIRPRLDQDWRPRANSEAAGPALAHAKALLPIDPVQPGWLTLFPQQQEQPPIAEASVVVGELSQLLAQFSR